MNNHNLHKLNLGCGNKFMEGYLNIDIVDYGGNMVFDLNNTPYPFANNTFDEIYCSHILEHLNNFHKIMNEIYRISKPNAKIIIFAPFFLNTMETLIIKFRFQ